MFQCGDFYQDIYKEKLKLKRDEYVFPGLYDKSMTVLSIDGFEIFLLFRCSRNLIQRFGLLACLYIVTLLTNFEDVLSSS
jgi:hypothetical protein